MGGPKCLENRHHYCVGQGRNAHEPASSFPKESQPLPHRPIVPHQPELASGHYIRYIYLTLRQLRN